ncbi:hypothetical protein LIER_37248 [Lithospermum erythrorhizon]|uniref:Uncharacterized protein n=1 Tax=Lithospermum erythrorhizon TaxID=34254 RepID=A0AAV3PKM1_LITER
MGSVKRETLRHAQMDSVVDLIGKEKLVWMHLQAVWDAFVKHWNTPKALKKSESARMSRGTPGADQLGLEESGVRPSPFEILLAQDRNKNKDSVADCVYNQKFEPTWITNSL